MATRGTGKDKTTILGSTNPTEVVARAGMGGPRPAPVSAFSGSATTVLVRWYWVRVCGTHYGAFVVFFMPNRIADHTYDTRICTYVVILYIGFQKILIRRRGGAS